MPYPPSPIPLPPPPPPPPRGERTCCMGTEADIGGTAATPGILGTGAAPKEFIAPTHLFTEVFRLGIGWA